MSDSTLTDAQLEANRENAKKSTGPRTLEGKQRSRNNSFKHGLTGATALLPSDNRDAYEEYVTGIVDSLHPGSLLEYEICRDVADAHWRLRRVHSVESKLLTEPLTPDENGEPPHRTREQDLHTAARVCLDSPNSLTNIALYEQRIHRTIKNSMEELRRLQAAREALVERDMPDALNHYKLKLMQDLPFDPAEHGFVFSFEEIDDALDREILQKRASHAASVEFDLAKYEKRYPKRAA